MFAKLAEEIRHKYSGSTISVACVLENKKRSMIAILGDSPVIAVTPKGVVMSPEHNVRTNIIERTATETRGGIYSRGYICLPDGNGLQLSRSLGDCEFGDIISKEPEIYPVYLGTKGALVIASDGLFDPSHYNDNKEDVKSIEKLVREGKGAQSLLDWANTKGPRDDNTTVIVYQCSKK
jgi:serine/threonine protein phosphatase PrpC